MFCNKLTYKLIRNIKFVLLKLLQFVATTANRWQTCTIHLQYTKTTKSVHDNTEIFQNLVLACFRTSDEIQI